MTRLIDGYAVTMTLVGYHVEMSITASYGLVLASAKIHSSTEAWSCYAVQGRRNVANKTAVMDMFAEVAATNI